MLMPEDISHILSAKQRKKDNIMKKFTEFLMNSSNTKKAATITAVKEDGSKRKHHLMYVNVGSGIVTLYD